MGNCLVTKLKGAVVNNNLEKLGEFKFYVKNNNSTTILPFAVIASSNFKVEISSPGYMYKGTIDSQTDITNSYEGSDTTGYRLSPGEYDISIISKYPITNLIINSNAIDNCLVDIDLKQLKYFTELSSIELGGKGIVGDTSDFFSYVSDYFPITLNLRNTDISGDIQNLAKLKIKTNTTIIGTADMNPMSSYSSINQSLLYGTVESFVSSMISQNYGKNYRFLSYNAAITFHNQIIINLPDNQNKGIKIVIDANGDATVHRLDDASIVYGTYTKSTNTWSYS
jgi:hypothetical protein